MGAWVHKRAREARLKVGEMALTADAAGALSPTPDAATEAILWGHPSFAWDEAAAGPVATPAAPSPAAAPGETVALWKGRAEQALGAVRKVQAERDEWQALAESAQAALRAELTATPIAPEGADTETPDADAGPKGRRVRG